MNTSGVMIAYIEWLQVRRWQFILTGQAGRLASQAPAPPPGRGWPAPHKYRERRRKTREPLPIQDADQPPYGRLDQIKVEETVMNPLKRIRRFTAVLAGLAGALVAFGATPAFAMHVPPPGDTTSPVGTTTPPVEVHTVVVGGMPGWQIALIAVVAALLAATAAVLLDRARSARRKAIAATA